MMSWLIEFFFRLADGAARKRGDEAEKRRAQIEESDRALREELARAEAKRNAARN
jgi:hypothetical protein